MSTMPDIQAPLPLSEHNIGLEADHPVILPSDYVRILVQHGKLSNLLGGHGLDCLAEFWHEFFSIRPEHPCFDLREEERNATVPVFLFADEGRGYKKCQLMVMGFEPVLGFGCEAEDAPTARQRLKANFKGSTYNTRMLFSVLPALKYSKDKRPLNNLVDVFASDLASCFRDGVAAAGMVIRLAVLNLKADLPAHSKMGLLTRHFLRESYPHGSGLCSQCMANTVRCPTWHEHDFDTAMWVRTIPHAPNPWLPHAESSLTAKIPMEAAFKAKFYHFDIFHTSLKGVHADLSGSAIVPARAFQQLFWVWMLTVLYMCFVCFVGVDGLCR